MPSPGDYPITGRISADRRVYGIRFLPPAASAFVFAIDGGPCARASSDAREAFGVQRMDLHHAAADAGRAHDWSICRRIGQIQFPNAPASAEKEIASQYISILAVR